jgi:hypothetical protein
MRRAFVPLLLVLAALAPGGRAVAAAPRLRLDPPRATFVAVDHALWLHVTWTPPAAATDVTVVVRQDGSKLTTLTASHWLVGAKTFRFALPQSVPAGATLQLVVRARSAAGKASTTLSVLLR